MSNSQLPIPPQEATKLLLKKMPSRRMRDVIEKRFGLKGGSAKTLQAIGREYRITRERVRQIEADALKHLSKPEHLEELTPLFVSIGNHIKYYGDAMAEEHLFANLAQDKHHSHVALLLDIGPSFHRMPETDTHHGRWTTDKTKADAAEKIMTTVVRTLENHKQPVSETQLHDIVQSSAKEVAGERLPEHVAAAYLASSKVIHMNPYGEYGLAWWSSVNPSGVKDKAYVAIAKAAKPLHFREVAEAINKAGWSKKKAHPQTVHNELIKDNRFVLVGRGLYALREWGYEPGTVRDVITSVLKETRHPMTKEEIIAAATQKRLVKVPTILLNLQNKSLFKKTEDGRYTLV